MLSRIFVVRISFFSCYSFFLDPEWFNTCLHWGIFALRVSCQKWVLEILEKTLEDAEKSYLNNYEPQSYEIIHF